MDERAQTEDPPALQQALLQCMLQCMLLCMLPLGSTGKLDGPCSMHQLISA
jgi:hypothetical protein